MLNRREMLKLSLLGGASTLLSTQCAVVRLFSGREESPLVTRFPDGWELLRPAVLDGGKRLTIVQREARHTFHPDLPPSTVWGYDGVFPGPTVHARVGSPLEVQFVNELPRKPREFGVPRTVVHLHGGHQPTRDDGFPTDLFASGTKRDYLYPNLPAGGDEREIPSTLWYHDHVIDFTAPNVYRGLLGCYLLFDELDSGDETDARSLRLPSGECDIPLVLTDKLFSSEDGRLTYDPFDHDGFLGDRIAVNGRLQPTLDVKRRRYRFRLVNASNARYYRIFLRREGDAATLPSPFRLIAGDGGLLEHPLPVESVLLSCGERAEVVVDFAEFREGDALILENRLDQWDGRGQNRLRKEKERGDELLRIRVGKAPGDGDPSQVPDELRPAAPLPSSVVGLPQETLVLDRKSGAWVINDRFFDPEAPLFTTRRGTPLLIKMINENAFWWHPMHFHLEFFRVLTRNGRPPAKAEAGRKDTVLLAPKEELELLVQFRDHPGRYVVHCHNLEHEDMSMMARYDVE